MKKEIAGILVAGLLMWPTWAYAQTGQVGSVVDDMRADSNAAAGALNALNGAMQHLFRDMSNLIAENAELKARIEKLGAASAPPMATHTPVTPPPMVLPKKP